MLAPKTNHLRVLIHGGREAIMKKHEFARRALLKGAIAGGAAAAGGTAAIATSEVAQAQAVAPQAFAPTAPAAAAQAPGYTFLNIDEAAFGAALVGPLIPAHETCA